MLFPVMVSMMFGVVDAASALIAFRRVTVAAETVVVIGTEMSARPDGTTSLTPAQAYQAATAIYGVMPQLKSEGVAAAFHVTLTAVYYTNAAVGCTGGGLGCAAQVAWSVAPLAASGLGANVVRTCGTLAQVPPGSSVVAGAVPTFGVPSLTSILVADVSYTFVPLFTRVFVGPQTFSHSAFLPPRLVSLSPYIAYDPANPKDPANCSPKIS